MTIQQLRELCEKLETDGHGHAKVVWQWPQNEVNLARIHQIADWSSAVDYPPDTVCFMDKNTLAKLKLVIGDYVLSLGAGEQK